MAEKHIKYTYDVKVVDKISYNELNLVGVDEQDILKLIEELTKVLKFETNVDIGEIGNAISRGLFALDKTERND